MEIHDGEFSRYRLGTRVLDVAELLLYWSSQIANIYCVITRSKSFKYN